MRQEDGDVPTASMVLTNAFVGALQALSAIQRLSGYDTSVFESVYWNAHSNELHFTNSDGVSIVYHTLNRQRVHCGQIKACQ